MIGVERIQARFERVNGRGEAALIPYVVGGYPDLRTTRELLWQCYEAGANLVELGIPFSDPVADGPTIARAAQAALGKGVTPRKCLEMVAAIRKEGFDIPILGMTYANLLFTNGYDDAARAWAHAGLDGAIVPDLPVDEAAELRRSFRRAGLGTTFFASPATSDRRVQQAMAASTAFLYLVAVYGTTGAREDVAPETLTLLRRAKRLRRGGSPPLCVGFGVSKPDHVRKLRAAGADGVVVGSALVRAVDEGRPVRTYLKSLKRATIDAR